MSEWFDRVLAFMSDPAVYPHEPAKVAVVQTHISAVFIAGDLVYKVKKPLDLGFLDFTTLEKRRFYCRQEVLLNSRFSEGIYLGVVSIREGPAGLTLAGEGTEVEVAVLMSRIPQDRFMINMLGSGAMPHETLDRVADRIAQIHANAPTGAHIAPFGSTDTIYGNLRENFDQTIPYIGTAIDRDSHEITAALAMSFLHLLKRLFDKRVKDGFIRDCHGDLHLDHVIILDGIMLYDCIEFNDRFRYCDTAADLAFLLMDLDYCGFPAYSHRVAARYVQSSRDADMLDLLGFYKSYRAFVRGKVAAIAMAESEISAADKSEFATSARDHFALSLAYLKQPPAAALIITAGLTGTGKSHLAEALGERIGVAPIRSDVLRKRIHGVHELEHRLDKYGQGIYTPSATDLTYRAMLENAEQHLSQGEWVILDASFMHRQQRDQARELARKMGARFRVVEARAADHVIKQRLQDRSSRQDEPSDGRWEIFLTQRTNFDPIGQDESSGHWVWDSSTDLHSFLTGFVRDLRCR